MLYGCTNKSDNDFDGEIINVNPIEADDFVNLSEIADSVKCIKLQVDSGYVMGRLREIIIMKKYIYAVDVTQKIIFVFDKTGRQVSKLDKKGQGPGEYLHIGQVFIDDDESFIELVNFSEGKETILKYKNISFEFVGKDTSYPDVNANSIKRKDGLYYFAPQQMDNEIEGKHTNAELIISDGKEFKVLFDKEIETNNRYFSMASECFSTNNKKELFFSPVYGNVFYQLKDWNAIPIIKVDFGKYGVPEYVEQLSTEKQMDYIQNMNNVASYPVLNMNDDKIMSFSYIFKQSNTSRWINEDDFRQYIKVKKTGKVYHTKKIKNDLTEFPDHIYISSYFFVCVHKVWYEDYLVDVIMPDFYFEDDVTKKVYVEGLGEISADSEPIIVLAKIK